MADYFTQFSCVLDVGTPDKAVAALDLFLRHHRALAEAFKKAHPGSAYAKRLDDMFQ